MSETNPYQPPAATLDQPMDVRPGELGDPRRVPFGHGWHWLSGGFDLFRRGWPIWIVNMLIFGVISTLLNLIPIVSLATAILSPMFFGGLMAGCLALDQGDELRVGHLFEGFSRNAGKLAGVGGLYLVGALAIGLVVGILVVATIGVSGAGAEMDAADQAELANQMGGMVAIIALIVLGLTIPLVMALWFAPALVMLHELGPLEAMKLSFMGCLRNMLPFLLYGLIALLLTVLALIPVGLGLLVLGPMVIASVYTGYKDIFLSQA